jgi:hypothetical protein
VVLRQTELAEKQVELLTQAFPDRKRLAVQWDVISADQFNAAEQRAKVLGLDVVSIRANFVLLESGDSRGVVNERVSRH